MSRPVARTVRCSREVISHLGEKHLEAIEVDAVSASPIRDVQKGANEAESSSAPNLGSRGRAARKVIHSPLGN
jgi:hypothetical protein